MSIEVYALHGVGMEQLRTGLLLKGPAVTSSPSIQTRFPFTHTAPEPLVPFTPHTKDSSLCIIGDGPKATR